MLYSKVNQLYVYMYPLFFQIPSHLGHHRPLRGVPFAMSRFSLVFYFIHAAAAAAAKSLQSCPTLCDTIDGSPLGSAIPGILQARTLEWVAISFSGALK